MTCELPFPRLSVAIPTFSRAQYLAEAVQSVLSQNYSNFELLISDDGVEPDIRSVGEATAMRDKRVRYWRNPKNLGLAGNWNRCLDEARGEYILIIGDDDRIADGGLASLASQIENGDDVVFANHHIIDHHGSRLPEETSRITKTYGRDSLPAGRIDNAEVVVWRNSIPICAALVRTVSALRIRFKEELNTPEIVLFAELARERATFRFVPAFVSEYRVHSGSITATGLRNDLLAARLIDIEVDPGTEPQKQTLLNGILTNGLKYCLLRGDVRKARQLRSSRYCSGLWRLSSNALLICACLCLPGTAPAFTYQMVRKIVG
jgi:glycosyltransferase involved in cell wall biosynthesis